MLGFRSKRNYRRPEYCLEVTEGIVTQNPKYFSVPGNIPGGNEIRYANSVPLLLLQCICNFAQQVSSFPITNEVSDDCKTHGKVKPFKDSHLSPSNQNVYRNLK